MNGFTRGVRNAFRNVTRTVALVLILGLSLGLALAMLVANQAVGDKIASVKSSVGNSISISPAGARGFDGGGTALTQAQIDKVNDVANVKTIVTSLSDRLTADDTDLESAVDAGSLGQRFSERSGQSFQVEGGGGGMMGPGGSGSTDSDSTDTTVTRSFTPPVTVNGTTDPTSLSSTQGGGTFTLKNGKVFTSDSSENVAIVGTSIATKNNLSVGSTFTAYGTSITVIGIFDAGNTFSNNQIIMPLQTVQTLSDQAGSITSATVTVDSVEYVATATKAIQTSLGSAADVTNDSEQAEESIAPLENIKTISLYSLIGAVAAGAVIIFMTMIMIVRERRREIGVIKAIGASNVKVAGQFVAEAMTLTLLAAIVGIVLGVAAANPITNMLVSNSTSSTSASQPMGSGPGGGFEGARRAVGGVSNTVTNVTTSVGWDIILYGLGAALLIAIIGSGIASLFIAKVSPAEVMRAE